jgi:N-acetylglucosamine malate deacetylase 1
MRSLRTPTAPVAHEYLPGTGSPSRPFALFALFALCCFAWLASTATVLAHPVAAQAGTPVEPERTILAVGAHAGDMELTAGAVLIRQRRLGDRVVVLHLTLGEGGNPRLSPSAYGAQKRAEALAVAEILGAEVIFGPYADGQLPDDEAARRYVSDVIRQVRPTHVITHWKHSFHKDHAAAHAITVDAVLLASLEGVASDYPRHRGVRGILFAENWEDMDGFQPYLHVGVSEEDVATWRRAVTRYEFVGGAISTFRYLDYYDALFTVRGALTRRDRAVAFDIDPFGKRQVLDHLR